MLKNLRRTGAVAGLIVAGVLALGAAPANADDSVRITGGSARTVQAAGWEPDFTADGVNIRSGPGTGYAVNGLGYRGDGIVDFTGSTSGTLVHCGNGRSTDWWGHITNRRTGVRGYISECFINFTG